jgi:DNA repair protein RadA/Sms
MMLAVLQRRANVRIASCDVFAASVGGARLTEPSVDLAVGLAVASATADMSVPPDLVAIGEVGLAGEIRRVNGIQRRIAEAERLGFRRAIIPAGSVLASGVVTAPARHLEAVGPDGDSGGRLRVTAVTNVRSAIVAALGARWPGD